MSDAAVHREDFTVVITAQLDSTKVRLDFGPNGYIDVDPERAQPFLSDPVLREQLRREIRRCHQQRQVNERKREQDAVRGPELPRAGGVRVAGTKTEGSGC